MDYIFKFSQNLHIFYSGISQHHFYFLLLFSITWDKVGKIYLGRSNSILGFTSQEGKLRTLYRYRKACDVQ